MILDPATLASLTRPICADTSETQTAEVFPEGVTPPGGSPPPAGKKTYRVTEEISGSSSVPSRQITVEVDWFE